MQTIRIPQERIGVLVGPKGATKRRIQKQTHTEIEVSEEGVVIEGDPLTELTALNIVHAIGRGFTPEKALRLLDEANIFLLVNITDYAGTSKSIHRLKGRIIGEKGRSRKKIERQTNTLISVYGKTVGIIGGYDDAEKAKEAVIMLLSGSRHATVYKSLEKQQGR